MKKHGVIINMTNNSLAFWLGHYTYIKAIYPTILSPPSLSTEPAAVRIEKATTPQKMITKGLKEDMTDFL